MAEEGEEQPQLVGASCVAYLLLISVRCTETLLVQTWSGGYDEDGKPHGQVGHVWLFVTYANCLG